MESDYCVFSKVGVTVVSEMKGNVGVNAVLKDGGCTVHCIVSLNNISSIYAAYSTLLPAGLALARHPVFKRRVMLE